MLPNLAGVLQGVLLVLTDCSNCDTALSVLLCGVPHCHPLDRDKMVSEGALNLFVQLPPRLMHLQPAEWAFFVSQGVKVGWVGCLTAWSAPPPCIQSVSEALTVCHAVIHAMSKSCRAFLEIYLL